MKVGDLHLASLSVDTIAAVVQTKATAVARKQETASKRISTENRLSDVVLSSSGPSWLS